MYKLRITFHNVETNTVFQFNTVPDRQEMFYSLKRAMVEKKSIFYNTFTIIDLSQVRMVELL